MFIKSSALLKEFMSFVKSFVLLNKFTEDKSLSQNYVYIFRFYTFYMFIHNFMIFIEINGFLINIVSFGIFMGP